MTEKFCGFWFDFGHYSLSDSAWADDNLAKRAEHLGKMVENMEIQLNQTQVREVLVHLVHQLKLLIQFRGKKHPFQRQIATFRRDARKEFKRFVYVLHVPSPFDRHFRETSFKRGQAQLHFMSSDLFKVQNCILRYPTCSKFKVHRRKMCINSWGESIRGFGDC